MTKLRAGDVYTYGGNTPRIYLGNKKQLIETKNGESKANNWAVYIDNHQWCSIDTGAQHSKINILGNVFDIINEVKV